MPGCSYRLTLTVFSTSLNPAMISALRSRRLLAPPSLSLCTLALVLLLEPSQSKFAPRWTKAEGIKEASKVLPLPADELPASSEGFCLDGRCDSMKSAEQVPQDSPLPPPYSTTLSIPVRAEEQIPSVSAPDHRTSSLHVPPGTVFYHGVTVGMTIVARDKTSKVVVNGGSPFVINVTDVGDSNTGSFFDLKNGTYFVYTTIYFSPALLKAKAPEIWVRLNGQHIQGSPYRMTIDVTKIARNYQDRVEMAEKVGKSDDLGGPGGCNSDFVIVTGASTSMFDRAVNLVGSIHYWAPGVPVIFYDLGLSSAQVEDVQTWENVDYRKFSFDQHAAHMRVDEKLTQNGTRGAYSWRAPILVEVLQQHQCMLWLDAGLEIRSDISVIIGHIAVDGNFFVTNGWPSPNRFTHPAVVQWHGLTERDFFLPDPTGTGVRNEIEACGGIQGYRRDSLAHREILSGYHTCLMDPTCIAPPNASKMNFRQDQTVLNVVLASYRLKIPLDSPEYFILLPHTARKYWEHPIPKHYFPVHDDGTFRPCDKGEIFRDNKCVKCDAEDGLCADDVLDEADGAKYCEDLVIFIRRAFEPKLYEEKLRYRLIGGI